ncbi:MAG: isocitrate lyase/PEP mutase family protein [Rhodospirillaceae bacterium]|nr:MAG: isocitrate lyase/PEP mutase family protein [Rhodospirillaceae bacterium]
MGSPAQKLRDLLNSGEHFIAADAYSAITGRIVERVGFKAAYLGGHACSAFHYAMPDIGIFSQVEQIEQAARIAAAIDIPLIADADTLGETVADAFHFTRRYERAGIAGFHVEDEVNPKHSSYVNGLMPIGDMQARLEACVKARRDPAFVIIARCDELYPSAYGGGGSGSVEAAIKRGRAYVEAGADALVFPFATPEITAQLKSAISIPFCVLGAPIPGTACTLHTGWGWTGAAQLHLARAKELFQTGAIASLDATIEGKDALIEQDLYAGLIADWAKKTGRPVR